MFVKANSLFIASLLFASISFALAVIAWSSSGDAPLHISPAQFESGSVRQGEVLPFHFQLKNNTSEVIRVTSIKKSCSCTEVDMQTPVLQPGVSSTINGEWSIGRARGKTKTHVVLKYHIGKNRDLHNAVCVLTAIVLPDVILTPEILVFSQGEASTKSVLVSAGEMEQVEVKDAYTTNAAFVAKAVGRGTVKVTFLPEKYEPPKDIAMLKIRTNSKNEEWCEVLLTVQ